MASPLASSSAPWIAGTGPSDCTSGTPLADTTSRRPVIGRDRTGKSRCLPAAPGQGCLADAVPSMPRYTLENFDADARATVTKPSSAIPLPVALLDHDGLHHVADLGGLGDVHALDDVAEEVVVLRELAGAVVDRDEELRAVRVRAGVGHRD